MGLKHPQHIRTEISSDTIISSYFSHLTVFWVNDYRTEHWFTRTFSNVSWALV